MRRFYLLLINFLVFVAVSFGQQVDTTFPTRFTTKQEPEYALYLPDGKYILYGQFVNVNGQNIRGIAQFNADGSIDNTFQCGTGVSGTINSMARQSDGKLLVAGYAVTYNGTPVKSIFRLNADGTIDNTFGQLIEFSQSGVQIGIYIQTDNKIVITGPVEKINNVSINEYIIRLNSDGTRDQTFDAETVSSIFALAFQADGKMVIGGIFSSVGSTTVSNIARLNANGTLDATFITGSGLNSLVRGIEVTASGRIVVGGSFTQYKGSTMNYLVALNNVGSVDATFTSNGAPTGAIYKMELQSDDKIVLAGVFTSIGTSAKNIARLSATGTLDASFNTNVGTGPNAYLDFVALNASNEVLVLGTSTFTTFKGQTRNGIALLNTDGTLKSMAQALTLETSAEVYDMVTVGSKILVSHNGNFANGSASAGLELINTYGSLDATFRSGLTVDNYIQTLFVESSGKILIGGLFTTYRGSAAGKIARIDAASGAIDATFTTGTGFSGGNVYVIAQQTDGKLLVGGNFSSFNGTTRRSIVRLNTDGTIDNTFNAANGFAGGTVYQIKIQSDGKILVGGEFTAFNAIAKNNLLRLNADGTIDNTFAIGAGFERPGAGAGVYAIEIDTDGKILAGGSFDRLDGVSLNSTSNSSFIKLNIDGTKDAQHTNQGLFIVEKLAKQPDGTILVLDRNFGLNRLKSNGTLDPTFLTVKTSIATTLAVQNGNIYAGGRFNQANDNPVSGIFKVTLPAAPTTATTLDGTATSATQTSLTWNDNSTTEAGFEIERSLTATTGFSVVATKTANVTSHIDNGLISRTAYYYRMRVFNAGGYSAYSNVNEITTLNTIPAPPTTAVVTVVSTSSLKLAWTDASNNENDFVVKRSTDNANFVTVATVTANTVTYEDTGLTPGVLYFYRIVSRNEIGESTFLYASGRAGGFIMKAGTIAACGGYLYDAGGESGNYAVNSDITTTLQPDVAGSSVELTIESLSTNAGFDVLSIYDGTSNTAPLIISYTGSSIGSTTKVRASTAGGALTVRFQTGSLTPLSGFRIKIACVVIPIKPTNINLSVINTQQVNLTWSDNSSDETGYEIERSLDPTNFVKIGTVGSNITQFKDNNTVIDKTYYYRVRAKGASDNSDFTIPVAIAYGTGGIWKSKFNFTGPGRTDAVAFAVGQKGYMGTGTTGAYTADIRAFDPATNNWTTVSGFGGSIRGEAVSFVIGTRAFVGTGYKFDREKDLWEYNDQTNVWTQKADFSGTARTGAVAFVANGKAFVGTGKDATGNKNDFAAYDPTANTWAAIAPFPGEARDGAVAFSINNIGYVGTGKGASVKKDFWKYDPVTNAWTAIADFPTAREEAVAFVVNGKAYVGTGDTGSYQRDFYRYDPVANTWVKVVSFGGTARLAASAFYIGANGYVATGYDGSGNLKDVWEFSEVEIPVAPMAPSVLVAAVKSSSSIQLSWTDNTSDETGFVLERSLTTEDNYTSIASLTSNIITYTDNDLVANTKYYYRVKAVTANGESGYALPVNGTTLPLPPSAPLNLSAGVISSSQIQLKWSASTGVAPVSYVVEHATSADGPFTVSTASYVFSSAESKFVLTDANLSSNTTYYFRVASKNAGGLSAYSGIIFAKTLVTPVAAPSNLAITLLSSTSARLTWTDNSTNEDSFELEKAVGSGPFSLWRTPAANATSSDETGLIDGEKYSFRIKAKSGFDYSDLSGTVTAITSPNAPSNLTGSLSDDLTKITLLWTDNSSKEIGFVIERSINNAAFITVDTVLTASYQETNLAIDKKISYRVYAYVRGKASDVSNVVTVVTTGIEDNNQNVLLKAYPNPAKDDVTLEFNSTYIGPVILEWYDLQGRKLKTHVLEKRLPNERHTFQAKEVGSGVLLLKIAMGDKLITTKLFVQ